MNFTIKFSENAIDDMAKLRSYITYNLQNPSAASSQVERIMSSIQKLSAFPKLYRVRKKDRYGNEIRAFAVDNYSVFYFLDEIENVVNITHVLYGRRDIDSLP